MAFVNVRPPPSQFSFSTNPPSLQNFATSFRWCDYIFGTDEKFRAYKARIRAAKNADQKAALEKKILEETEKEGFRAEAEAEKSGGWLKSESKTKVL